MNHTLKVVVALAISFIIIKILMNVIYHFGIDYVGFFEDVWNKMKRIK